MQDSLAHEPGHAGMAGVAERGDGRAELPRRARCDRAALLYFPINMKAKNRKRCASLAAPKPSVSKCSRVS